ncbi:MAG: Fe-S-containing protein [Candidatus Binataceae bacterium]
MSAHRRRKSRVAFWVIAIVGAVALSVFASWSRPDRNCIQARANSDLSLIDVRALASGDARKYCIKILDSHVVRLIVVRRSDGQIQVVLDACRTCYGNNLGYKFAGHEIICRFCSNRYSIDSISARQGSCAPLTMPFEEHGGLLKIRLSDLKKGEAFFPAHSPDATILASVLRWFDRLMHKQNRRFAMLSD